MIALLIAAAAATAIPTAPATTVSPATVTAPAKAKPDPNVVVCWNEAEVGSRIPKRLCSTRAELERIQQQNQDELRRTVRPSAMTGGGMGGMGMGMSPR